MISTLLHGVMHASVAELWSRPLQSAALYWDVDPSKYTWWLANLLHEAGASFLNREENLRYTTARRLMEVWPTRFRDEAHASEYLNEPQKLANMVYANRMGNGPPASGDGWKYRGRGLIQLTGKNNYVRYEKASAFPVVDNPELLFYNHRVAADSAAWYWYDRKLNGAKRFEDVVRLINGGLIGLQDRRIWLERLEKVPVQPVRYPEIDKVVLHEFSWSDVSQIAMGVLRNKPAVLGPGVASYTPSYPSSKLDVRRTHPDDTQNDPK